jgi:hypothetical protein
MSKDFQLPNGNMWEHLNEYVLVKQIYKGEVDYLIYHMPTRTALVIEDDAEDKATVEKMLQLKVQIIDIETLKLLLDDASGKS